MTLHLHYWPTPNGKKVTVFLEEAEMPYVMVPCDLANGDQFAGDFPAMNPNTRMPLLVDDEPSGGGAPISVFESGAIMLYLAEKSGKFWPQTPREKYAVVQWVTWQMANQGPKIGEFGHFKRLGESKGDQSYAMRRFADETNRLYGVLNNGLYKRQYLAGDAYSIADMICYPWTVKWQWQDQDLAEFPHFKRWFEELSERPALRRGMEVGAELGSTTAPLPPEAEARRMKMLYNQRARPAPAS